MNQDSESVMCLIDWYESVLRVSSGSQHQQILPLRWSNSISFSLSPASSTTSLFGNADICGWIYRFRKSCIIDTNVLTSSCFTRGNFGLKMTVEMLHESLTSNNWNTLDAWEFQTIRFPTFERHLCAPAYHINTPIVDAILTIPHLLDCCSNWPRKYIRLSKSRHQHNERRFALYITVWTNKARSPRSRADKSHS